MFTGPVISSDPERIGPGQVAVPTHTFKVILAVQASRSIMYAAIVPNETAVAEPLETFATSVDHVEWISGFDFFSDLDDDEESRLEAMVQQLPAGPRP